MAGKLIRYQHTGQFHFLTVSCYRRKPLLGHESAYACFERELEGIRKRYGLVVAGYVLLPEHVHLLVGEPAVSSLSVALQVLKQQTSRKLKIKGKRTSGSGGIMISTSGTMTKQWRNSSICTATRSGAA